MKFALEYFLSKVVILFAITLCFAPFAHAEPSQVSGSSQAVESLSEESARLLHEYRQVLRQENRLLIYNNQVDRMIAAQEEEMASFKQQLREIEITNSEILPLILKMLERLEQYVSLDLPFLAEKRRARLSTLRELIDRPDLNVAEKYRHVIEAYQIELAYGRTIEATTGTMTGPMTRASIDQGGNSRMVHLLRIGRVALYSLSFDGKEAAYWDSRKREWQELSGEHRQGIAYGLRIARKETPPNLLKLPMMSPEPGMSPENSK